MPKLTEKLPDVLAGTALAVAALVSAAALVDASPTGSVRVPDAFSTLVALALVTLVGRAVLAVLPPGPIGSHRPGELPATLATSFAVGVTAVGYTEIAYRRLGDGASALLLLAPFAAVAALRLVLRPGAMVPRHAPRRTAPTALSRALLALTLVGFGAVATLALGTPAADELGRARTPVQQALEHLAPGGAWDPRVVGLAAFAVVLISVRGALATARRSATTRGALVLALALTPLVAAQAGSAEVVAAALLATALSGGVAWLRRADRRGRAVALVALAGLPITCWKGFAIASVGYLALVVTTPPPSRRPLALTAGAIWIASWPIASRFAFELSSSEPPWVNAGFAERVRALFDWQSLGGLGALAFVAAAAGLVLALVTAKRSPEPPAPDRDAAPAAPGRERVFALLLAAALFVTLDLAWPIGARELPRPSAVTLWAGLAGLITLPVAAVAGALAFAPAERS